MTETKWSEQLIIHKLVGESRSAFPSSRNVCVPNVSYGFCDGHEADLLVVRPSGYLLEIEVKISLADLRNDYKKTKHRNWERESNNISELYYAMPLELWEKVSMSPPIPEYAGVIVIDPKLLRRNRCHVVVRKAQRHKFARKLTELEVTKLSRLVHLRYWSLSHKNFKTKSKEHAI